MPTALAPNLLMNVKLNVIDCNIVLDSCRTAARLMLQQCEEMAKAGHADVAEQVRDGTLAHFGNVQRAMIRAGLSPAACTYLDGGKMTPNSFNSIRAEAGLDEWPASEF